MIDFYIKGRFTIDEMTALIAGYLDINQDLVHPLENENDIDNINFDLQPEAVCYYAESMRGDIDTVVSIIRGEWLNVENLRRLVKLTESYDFIIYLSYALTEEFLSKLDTANEIIEDEGGFEAWARIHHGTISRVYLVSIEDDYLYFSVSLPDNGNGLF